MENVADEDWDHLLTVIENFDEAQLSPHSVVHEPPQIDMQEAVSFPLLSRLNIKNAKRESQMECSKCVFLKKRCDDKIAYLERIIQSQHEELFEMYSYLNARLSELEKKT